MTDHSGGIDEVKKSIDRERTNLLTVIAALSFLCISLFVSNIFLGAYTISAINERDAVSVALDDQRLQYYQCLRDEEVTANCDEKMVSPASRDIMRDLESAGFSELIYPSHIAKDDPVLNDKRAPLPQAFGLLGRIIY